MQLQLKIRVVMQLSQTYYMHEWMFKQKAYSFCTSCDPARIQGDKPDWNTSHFGGTWTVEI